MTASHEVGHEHGSGHHGHADHAEMFRRKFWVSLALTVPTVFYSSMVQDWLGYTRAALPRTARSSLRCSARWCSLWGGPVFLRGGWDELRARQPGMMLLISMGLVVAFGASVATEFGWIDVDLWFELATLGDDHAARPLVGDAGHRPSAGRARRARRAVAGRGRASHRRRRRTGRASTRFVSVMSCSFDRAAESRPTASSSTAKPSSTKR